MFTKVHHCTFPPAMNEGCNFSTSSSTFVIVCLFNYRHSSGMKYNIIVLLIFIFLMKIGQLFFLYSRFLLVIHFIHVSVYMSIPISQFIPPPPPPTPAFPPWCPYICSLHLRLFLPCKPVHLYHFSRLHIYALIYDSCFSLSDLLHSI